MFAWKGVFRTTYGAILNIDNPSVTINYKQYPNIMTLPKYLALILVCTFNFNYAQKKEVDSLIQKINNNDAYIVLTKTASPRIKGNSANRIIEIGKSASPQLIRVLENPNKGIAAHFILSKIWKEIWKEEDCSNIENLEEWKIIIINGLEIRTENNSLYSTPESLTKQKKIWKKLCHV